MTKNIKIKSITNIVKNTILDKFIEVRITLFIIKVLIRQKTKRKKLYIISLSNGVILTI